MSADDANACSHDGQLGLGKLGDDKGEVTSNAGEETKSLKPRTVAPTAAVDQGQAEEQTAPAGTRTSRWTALKKMQMDEQVRALPACGAS